MCVVESRYLGENFDKLKRFFQEVKNIIPPCIRQTKSPRSHLGGQTAYVIYKHYTVLWGVLTVHLGLQFKKPVLGSGYYASQGHKSDWFEPL